MYFFKENVRLYKKHFFQHPNEFQILLKSVFTTLKTHFTKRFSTVYPWMFCKTCLELATITKGSLGKSKVSSSPMWSNLYYITIRDDYCGWQTRACYAGKPQEICILFFNKGLFWQVRYSDGEVLGHFYYFSSYSECFWSILYRRFKLFMQRMRGSGMMVSIIVWWETSFSLLGKQCQESISIYHQSMDLSLQLTKKSMGHQPACSMCKYSTTQTDSFFNSKKGPEVNKCFDCMTTIETGDQHFEKSIAANDLK